MATPSLTSVWQTPLHVNALCPTHDGLVLVGMYEHVAAEDKRLGRLVLVDPRRDDYHELSALDTDVVGGGVFDVRPGRDATYLAAGTDGTVMRFSATNDPLQPRLEELKKYKLHDLMATTAFELDTNALVATHHQGAVTVADAETAVVQHQLLAHEFDAWNGAAIGGAVFATGGDDGLLKLWDSRELGHADGPRATLTARFECGVVCVVPARDLVNVGGCSEHHVVVGTYDEQVHIVDLRKPKSRLSSQRLGGGAWRIRSHRCGTFVAAMQGGACQVQLGDSVDVVSSFHNHVDTVLVYDVAAVDDVVLSASFYDNEVRRWARCRDAS